MPSAALLMPLTFAVVHDDEPADVSLTFADNADVAAVTRWRVPSSLKGNPTMRARAADACEFARLAAKRWRHYRDTSTAAASVEALSRMIVEDPQGEYCFHLKIVADWFPGSLGGAMIRRTWCHHLMIDFLFVHPTICGKLVDVKTVGFQLLQAICFMARDLGCKRVWGEATRDSAAFYARQLGREVEDHFSIERHEIHRFAARLEAGLVKG